MDSLFAARTWTHTEPNVTGEEKIHVYGPTGDSNRGPLAYRARTQTTELNSHTHRRPVIISICLIRFIPESTRNHAGTDETAPVLSAAQTWTHTELQNVKGEGIIFTPAEDRICDPLHANPNLYRVTIKAGLYRKSVQVCFIYTTHSGIHRGYLPLSVAGSFQFCKICLFVFSYGEVV